MDKLGPQGAAKAFVTAKTDLAKKQDARKVPESERPAAMTVKDCIAMQLVALQRIPSTSHKGTLLTLVVWVGG